MQYSSSAVTISSIYTKREMVHTFDDYKWWWCAARYNWMDFANSRCWSRLKYGAIFKRSEIRILLAVIWKNWNRHKSQINWLFIKIIITVFKLFLLIAHGFRLKKKTIFKEDFFGVLEKQFIYICFLKYFSIYLLYCSVTKFCLQFTLCRIKLFYLRQ